MLNREVFENLLLELENYFGKKLSPFVRNIYFEKLIQCSEEQFESAVVSAITKFSVGDSFFPSAQQLYDFALFSTLGLNIEPFDGSHN